MLIASFFIETSTSPLRARPAHVGVALVGVARVLGGGGGAAHACCEQITLALPETLGVTFRVLSTITTPRAPILRDASRVPHPSRSSATYLPLPR